MRPIDKLVWPQDAAGVQKSYNPHGLAIAELEGSLGCYCSYCEVFSSDLEVEHVISRHQDDNLAHNWDNFLLACGRCNGKGNKGNKNVDFNLMHFPHLNNTYKSFVYKEAGFAVINPVLNKQAQLRAKGMMSLLGLDKYPGNPDYPNLNPNDSRWRHRRTSWESAVRYLGYYEDGKNTAAQIADFAKEKGFFSVWFTVFAMHIEVKKLLIETFSGTSFVCFDPQNNYSPIDRNPANLNDPT